MERKELRAKIRQLHYILFLLRNVVIKCSSMAHWLLLLAIPHPPFLSYVLLIVAGLSPNVNNHLKG
jgi:hypothetical protein